MVQGLGFRGLGLKVIIGFRVQGLGFRVQGQRLGFRVLRLRVRGLGSLAILLRYEAPKLHHLLRLLQALKTRILQTRRGDPGTDWDIECQNIGPL